MYFQTIRKRVARLVLLVVTCITAANYLDKPAMAREAIESSPSAILVAGLFNRILEVTFPTAQGSGSSVEASPDQLQNGKTGGNEAQMSPESRSLAAGHSARIAALRQILSETVDSESIARFILGRYANAAAAATKAGNGGRAPEVRSPADGFLDFAASTVAQLGSGNALKSRNASIRPALTIFNMTTGRDEIRLVTSELVLPNGQALPLTWKVAPRAGVLKIEDVECLGISLRLMLRSAVARAAAEHPDETGDLGELLGVAAPFAGTFDRAPKESLPPSHSEPNGSQ